MRHPRSLRIAPAAALAALLVVGGAPSAVAHGDTIAFDIVTSQPADGHVRTVATWENDKDPVTESIAGTLSAVDVNGRSLGPWKLVPVDGAEATYTTSQALPPGRWKVTVDCGFPDLGHGQATVDVPAAGKKPTGAPSAPADPPKDRPAGEATPKASTRKADGDDTSDDSSSAPVWVGAAAAVVLGGGAAFLVARRRARR